MSGGKERAKWKANKLKQINQSSRKTRKTKEEQ
jgi:hypothetical protein